MVLVEWFGVLLKCAVNLMVVPEPEIKPVLRHPSPPEGVYFFAYL